MFGFGVVGRDGEGGDEEGFQELTDGVVEVKEAAAVSTLVSSEEGIKKILDQLINVGAVGDAAFVFGLLTELEEMVVDSVEGRKF